MKWIGASFVIWILLKREFQTYKQFATVANPQKGASATPGQSLVGAVTDPLTVLNPLSSLNTMLGSIFGKLP